MPQEREYVRDERGRFAAALAAWAERRAGAKREVEQATMARQSAGERLSQLRPVVAARRERVAGKERAFSEAQEHLRTLGMENAALARVETARVNAESGAAMKQTAVESKAAAQRVLERAQGVLAEPQPRREDFPEEHAVAPPQAPSPMRPPGRVPRDVATFGRWAGRRASEIPETLNHAHIANATRQEVARRAAAGEPALVIGSREHREHVEQFRRQHEAARAHVGGAAPATPAATPAPAALPQAPKGDNAVRIAPRDPAQRAEIKRQNERAFGERTASGLDRMFGDKVPTREDFQRGFGLNDGTRARVEVSSDGHETQIDAQHYDREHGNAPMLSHCSRRYSRVGNDLSVYHAHFNVKPEYRSTGIGAQILANSVRLHHELGVRTIRTSPAGSDNGWSYDKWQKNAKDTKDLHDAYRAGRISFDRMRDEAHRLDTGYIGPHAWATMGFTHNGSYERSFASYLHEHHHESIVKMALGDARHAEITSTIARGVTSRPGERRIHPDVAAHVASARTELSRVPDHPLVAKASAALAEVERHHAAGTLTREHLTAAHSAILGHFQTEQGRTAYGSPPRVALNQSQLALERASQSIDRPWSERRAEAPARPLEAHLTPEERTRVRDKANEVAHAVGGQGRDIVGFVLPDGRKAGSHFMATQAGNPHGTWWVKMERGDQGWEQMKRRLRLHDLQ